MRWVFELERWIVVGGRGCGADWKAMVYSFGLWILSCLLSFFLYFFMFFLYSVLGFVSFLLRWCCGGLREWIRLDWMDGYYIIFLFLLLDYMNWGIWDGN